MGQKVNPNGLRIGINRDWSSHWYASKKDFSRYLKEDNLIRDYLKSKFESKEEDKDCGLSHIDIERVRDEIRVSIFASKIALVLGEDKKNLERYQLELSKKLGIKKDNLKFSLIEVVNPYLDAVLVAKDIAHQLENRGSSRIVQKKAIQNVMRAGAMGCKTMCKGRVNGAEIARYEEYREGVLSLHTLRQNVDYAYTVAHTTSGCIGVKVWIALPENYEELRKKKPEDFRGRRNFRRGNRNGGSRFRGNGSSAPRQNSSAKPAAAK